VRVNFNAEGRSCGVKFFVCHSERSEESFVIRSDPSLALRMTENSETPALRVNIFWTPALSYLPRRSMAQAGAQDDMKEKTSCYLRALRVFVVFLFTQRLQRKITIILNAVKNLVQFLKILHCAQNDKEQKPQISDFCFPASSERIVCSSSACDFR
jgi:hypothetical protein